MDNIVTKICSKCEKEKPLNSFPKNRSQCKNCRKEYNKQYFDKNKNKLLEYMRSYYSSNKDSAIKRAKAWRENNKEKHRAACDKYVNKDIQKSKESSKRRWKKWASLHSSYRSQWIAKNPYKGRQYSQKRRARVLGNGGEITSREWEQLLNFYGRKCLCCGKTEGETPIHLDHVVPISRGGANVIENAQPLCKSCNSAKHDKIIDYRT